MEVKLLEIRDAGTFIPMLCVNMNPTTAEVFEDVYTISTAQRFLLRRCGYPCDGQPNIAMTPLRCDGDPCTNDPYWWGDRTRKTAHHYITENWSDLRDGDVVDVEFILGETAVRKRSERFADLPA
jgi:hypothetical protein